MMSSVIIMILFLKHFLQLTDGQSERQQKDFNNVKGRCVYTLLNVESATPRKSGPEDVWISMLPIIDDLSYTSSMWKGTISAHE